MKTFITTILVLFLATVSVAQEKKADRLFNKWQYADAAKLYEEAVKKNPSPDLYYKLGYCYQKMFLYKEAVNAYDQVNNGTSAGTSSYSNPEFYFNYGLMLKANARYEDAKTAFLTYIDKAPNDPRGKFYLASCDVVLDDLKKPMGVTVTNLASFNTPDAAFLPTKYKHGIVYASNAASSTGKKTFPWNDKSYLDMRYAERDSTSDTTLTDGKPFDADRFNTQYHDGPATFTKNYDTIYFNRVMRSLKGEKKRTIGVEHSKIFYATLDKDGKWSEEKPFILNNDSFGVFTPYVTPDGQRIYFASDMPGGMGETDIYYCVREGDKWGRPINLGSNVNTWGREQYPSLDDDGNLYFASDGYMGYGGLDIVVSRMVYGGFQKGEVLKAPLNSPGNDYGIMFLKNKIAGYLSSSREGGKGDADIYYFNLEQDSLPCEVNTSIYVIGFQCKPKELVAKQDSLTVTPTQPSLSNILILPIYYDFDKSDIRPDAAQRLDSIINLMKQHPDWNLEVAGNADCRGSDQYNLALSQRRADAAIRYVAQHGIDKRRLTTKANGESQPVNRCVDGVECSEAEHQQNRRVEFTLILHTSGPVSTR